MPNFKFYLSFRIYAVYSIVPFCHLLSFEGFSFRNSIRCYIQL